MPLQMQTWSEVERYVESASATNMPIGSEVLLTQYLFPDHIKVVAIDTPGFGEISEEVAAIAPA